MDSKALSSDFKSLQNIKYIDINFNVMKKKFLIKNLLEIRKNGKFLDFNERNFYTKKELKILNK